MVWSFQLLVYGFLILRCDRSFLCEVSDQELVIRSVFVAFLGEFVVWRLLSELERNLVSWSVSLICEGAVAFGFFYVQSSCAFAAMAGGALGFVFSCCRICNPNLDGLGDGREVLDMYVYF